MPDIHSTDVVALMRLYSRNAATDLRNPPIKIGPGCETVLYRGTTYSVTDRAEPGAVYKEGDET